MKTLALVVALTAVAHADPAREVEKTVRAYFTHVGDQAQVESLVRGDAVLVVDHTYTLNAHRDSSTFLQAVAIKKVDSLVVHVDDVHHAAWFRGFVVAETVDPTGDGCQTTKCAPPQKLELHVAGLAIDEKGWKLQAIFVTETMADHEFIRRNKPVAEFEKLDKNLGEKGDHDLLAATRVWIGGGLAAGAASGSIFAQGSELVEVGTDAKARVLAGRWDKLELWPSTLDVTTFGDLGFVYGICGWPVKGGDIPRRIAAIAVKDHGTWKWIVLDFG